MSLNSHDRTAFLRAICAAPDDDAPRLIYADWLDENGEDEPAAFIREQIRLARLPCWHPDVLEARFTQRDTFTGQADPLREVLPPLPDGLVWDANPYVRGLPERVRLSKPMGVVALKHIAEYIAPVRALQVSEKEADCGSCLEPLIHSETMRLVTDLRCDWQREGDGLMVLYCLRSLKENAAQLRNLRLDLPHTYQRGVSRLLKTWYYRRLRSFSLSAQGYVFPHDFFSGLRSPDLCSCTLQRLLLRHVLTHQGYLADLVNTPHLQTLRVLELQCANDLDLSEYWELFPNSRFLKNLEVLRCSGFLLRLQASAILRAEHFSALRWLDLSDNQILPDTVKVLANTTFVPHLTCLELAGNLVQNRGAKELARVPFTQLAVLNLHACQIANDGALALARASFATKLRFLDLTNNNLDEKTQQRLRDLLGPRVRL